MLSDAPVPHKILRWHGNFYSDSANFVARLLRVGANAIVA
jgi:hypothetical protein